MRRRGGACSHRPESTRTPPACVCTVSTCCLSGLEVPDSWAWVSDFWFRVPGSGFRASGSWIRIPRFGFRVLGLGFRVDRFGIRDSGVPLAPPLPRDLDLGGVLLEVASQIRAAASGKVDG